MLNLSYTAKTFSCRPSSFIAGLSGYEAYCLDSACALFIGLWENKNHSDKHTDPNLPDASTFL